MLSSMVSPPLLACQNLSHIYRQGTLSVPVLEGINLAVHQGETIALMGPSGAGKSTLLHMLGLLDVPTRGDVLLEGQPVQNLTESERTALRLRCLGFVYQFHHLLPELTALENVILPQRIQKTSWRKAEKRAKDLLGRVGLTARANHRPGDLSGGERQRLALIRALATSPHLLLADEPTGSLDTETAETVFTLLLEIVRETGLTLIMATHNMAFAQRLDGFHTLKNGHLHTDF